MSEWASSVGIGTYYQAYFAWYVAALALATLALALFGKRIPRWMRSTATTIVLVLTVRLLLFDNPFTLRLYQRTLDNNIMGLRQSSVLELEITKYRRENQQPTLANLAVGSSQVGAMFYHWESDTPQPLGVYSLAGMKALDYVLNEDRIAAYNPARIILYTSAFDMTGSPELFSLPLAPPKLGSIWPVYSRLRAAGLRVDEIAPSFHAYIASQVLPEYRYTFIYRAYLKQWFGLPATTATAPTGTSTKGLTEFSNYYDPQWLDYNFIFLREFLEFCRTRGIEVVIAEGQINPSARDEKIVGLNDIVRARIRQLTREFPQVFYVPVADTYEFTPEEYYDTTHVRPEAARRYTKRLSDYLASARR